MDSTRPVSADSTRHLRSGTEARLDAYMCTCIVYPTMFSGLVTSPCHGLIDTGAQDGVVGLFDWQRWVVCLALVHGLQPLFRPVPERAEAGGIGGQAKVLAVCIMPTGLAGVNGVSKWVVLDEPDPNHRVPPLIPITLLKELDAVIEPKEKRVTLRFTGSVTELGVRIGPSSDVDDGLCC